MLDTPGILEPTFEDIETGFKLASLSIHLIFLKLLLFFFFLPQNLRKLFSIFLFYYKDCVKNHQINSDILADYLLFKLNKANQFKYI